MTPSEALIHPWIMEGLNSQLAIEHLKNLGLDKQQIENKTKTSRNNHNIINMLNKTQKDIQEKNSNRENFPVKLKEDFNKTMDRSIEKEGKFKQNKILTIKLKKMALSPKYALKLFNLSKNQINKK